MMAVLEPLGRIFIGVLLTWVLVAFTVAAIDVLIIMILAASDLLRDIRSRIQAQWRELKHARGAR